MKRVLLLLLVFASSTAVFGQTYDTEVDVGVRLKYNITSYSKFKQSDLPDGYDLKTFGYAVGGFLQMRVNHFYFQPELTYSYIQTTIAAPLENDPNYDHGEIELRFNSFQLPLLVGYRTSFDNVALRFGAGPVFTYLFDTNGVLDYTPGAQVDVPEDLLTDFNDFTLSARFGVGLDVGAFLFDVMYEKGFSRLNEEFTIFGGEDLGKESSWVFGVGFKIIRHHQ